MNGRGGAPTLAVRRGANLALVKKTATENAPKGWQTLHSCTTWDDADRYVVGIINNERREARIRYQQPYWLVESKTGGLEKP